MSQIEPFPVFQEPPAEMPAASAEPVRYNLAEVLLAGFWYRYPTLIRMFHAVEQGFEVRLTHPNDVPREPVEPEPEVEEEPEEEPGEDFAEDDAEPDPWGKYLQRPVDYRNGFLAKHRIPFRVRGVRRWRERSGGTRWHLLIAEAPLGNLGVVKLPIGNAQRDAQLQWLTDEQAAGRHGDLVLCFFLQAAGRYQRVCLERSTWPAPDARWDHLPVAVRERLLRRETGT